MMHKQQQYQTSDYKCTFIDIKRRPEARVRANRPTIEADAGSISKRSSMLRNAMVVLAIVLVIGSSGLSTSAFARGGGVGDGLRGNHFGDGFGTSGDGYSGYGNHASRLRGGFRRYGGHDVWGHWGTYYGPMIPNIF
jgi:hypothetical protein